MDVNDAHPAKQTNSILVNEFGIITDVNDEEHSKQQYPILVTEFGIIMDVNNEHSLKRFSSNHCDCIWHFYGN
jgi:hypothetical protein